MKKFSFLLILVFFAQLLVAQECDGISGSISPSNATICEGSSVLLTLASIGGSSVEWQLDGVVINGETGSNLTATQAGTYSAIIIEGTCRVPASNTVEVTVNPNPSGNISPANPSICSGGSVTLTATGGTSYTWFRNGIEINGENNATIDVSAAGTYSATLHQGDCSAPASNTSEVTVTPAPTGTISPSNPEICTGGSVILTATGGTSYIWFRNGTLINGQTDATFNATQAGTYSVTINQGTCSGPASNTSTVIVSSAPTGTISPSNTSICPSGSTVLTATGGSSYTWFRNGNEINGETDATLNVTQPGTYSVTINLGNCSGPASNTSTVTVTPAPTGTISPAIASICIGGSTVLTATGGTSYTWFRNGNEINGETDATLTVTQAGTYSVIINQGTCSGAASNTSTVIVASAPTGTISPANASICSGTSTVLTATGGTSYTWFRDGNEINGETHATLTITQAGTYSVTINQGDCSGPASNTSVVSEASIPTGTISPASASICEGSSAELTATGGSSYIWFRNGNVINGENNATLTVTQNGIYSVTIQQGDCIGQASNTSEVTVIPLPTGSISPATSSICTGASQVLTASGGSSYTWFLNGNEIAGETGSTITVTQAGTYTTTIHQGDCSGPSSNSSIVTVLPVPTGTISPAASTICEDGALVLTATGGTSYTWFKNGNEIANETNATLTINEPGTYSAIIRQGTCSGPALNVAVISLANSPSGTISPSTGSICAGGSMVLTASGGSSYTWFRNGNQINNETSATLTINQPGTYFAIIRQGNCSGPALNTSVITQATAPTGTISPADGALCEGSILTLTATGGSSYVWFRDGNQINGQTSSTLDVTQPGTYSVTIQQGNCSGPASNSVVVTSTTTPTGTISPATAALCGGGSQVLTATGGTSYSWMRDGVVINGQESATITVTESGTYSAVIKNGTCNGPASNTVTVTVENVNGTHYPDVNARPNIPVQLMAREIGVAYEWTPAAGLSDPSSVSPTVTTTTDRQYIVKITTAGGCVVSDTVNVKVKVVIFVPTAFSPDGNGTNDILRPLGELNSIEKFKIFNRWGQLMFETNVIGAGWDGKFKGADQPSDTYTWILTGVGKDGLPLKLSGKTLLVR